MSSQPRRIYWIGKQCIFEVHTFYARLHDKGQMSRREPTPYNPETRLLINQLQMSSAVITRKDPPWAGVQTRMRVQPPDENINRWTFARFDNKLREKQGEYAWRQSEHAHE